METILKKYINILERVQKRATKMINGFSEIKYETRLENLGLTTQETRRLRGDLIEVFKILKGYDDGGEDIFFVRSKSSLRGHQLKLQKKSVRLDIAKYSFSNRVVNEWNNLSKEVIASKSLAGFLKKLDFQLCNNRRFI